MDPTTISLQAAFGKPGCPLCRLRRRSEQRYLSNLLYENVNDGTTRAHLVRGMGLCPQHAWALQAIEQERWRDGLGVGIIYEDLTRRVLARLTDYLDRNPTLQAGSQTWLRQQLERWGTVGRWLARRLLPSAPGRSLLARLAPAEDCCMCRHADRMEEIRLKALVRGLADPEFRRSYTKSTGLCLPHLRQAFAATTEELAVRCLAQKAVAELDPLRGDLGEYVRKHNWSHRDEPRHPWEQASWVRAVAFFSGEAPHAYEERVSWLRRQAITDYQLRK